jgi:DNA-binding winged helix-turn-helix (wHTH) protein/tetratricopeptide (TPR) repeat protein
VLEFGAYRFDADQQLWRGTTRVALTPKERAVLARLLAGGGRVVDRHAVLNAAWPGEDVGEASLMRCVSTLRAKLGPRPGGGSCIETAHGVGYRVTVPIRVATPQVRVLVLPLVAEDGQAPSLPVCDAITEDIIGHVCRLHGRGLVAIGSDTALRCRGDGRGAAVIGRSLGADLAVILRWRRHRGSASVRLQVVRTSDLVQLASVDVPVPTSPVEQVAAAIAAALLPLLPNAGASGPRMRDALATTPQASHAYLDARFHFRRRTPASLADAITFLERALAADPRHAAAAITLAECHGSLLAFTLESAAEAEARVEALLTRASAVDPDLPGVRALRAGLFSAVRWRFDEAEALFLEAMREDGPDVYACQMYGRHALARGRAAEAVRLYALAAELDPLAPAVYAPLAFALACDGRLPEVHAALTTLDALGSSPSPMPLLVRSVVRALEGAPAEALDHAAEAHAMAPAVPMVRASLAWACAVAGDTRRARDLEAEAAADPGFLAPGWMAMSAMARQDVEAAERWLQRALAIRCYWCPTLRVDPRFAAGRAEPRLARLLATLET